MTHCKNTVQITICIVFICHFSNAIYFTKKKRQQNLDEVGKIFCAFVSNCLMPLPYFKFRIDIIRTKSRCWQDSFYNVFIITVYHSTCITFIQTRMHNKCRLFYLLIKYLSRLNCLLPLHLVEHFYI